MSAPPLPFPEAVFKRVFLERFVQNDADSLCLRLANPRPCEGDGSKCKNTGLFVVYDYEESPFLPDTGWKFCLAHKDEFFSESEEYTKKAAPWVTQDPEGAWNGVGTAEGHGWGSNWNEGWDLAWDLGWMK